MKLEWATVDSDVRREYEWKAEEDAILKRMTRHSHE
jgi:hypothetical protein